MVDLEADGDGLAEALDVLRLLIASFSSPSSSFGTRASLRA